MSKQKKEIMRRITSLGNSYRVETFDLSEELHDVVVNKMVRKHRFNVGGYRLDSTDGEMANVWIADAHSEGNEEYAEFLREALASGADLYTLKDTMGGFDQEIGEVAVYDC